MNNHLVNPEYFTRPLVPKKIKWWNINIILLITFVVFMVFFLYNCKYGYFKLEEGPLGVSI
jgi:hypothetical protein